MVGKQNIDIDFDEFDNVFLKNVKFLKDLRKRLFNKLHEEIIF